MTNQPSHQILTTYQDASTLTRYNYLISFCMLYMSIMLCSAVLTNRYVSLNPHIFVLGGTLTSPFVFILGDMVAEIFGYKVAKKMIWGGFACQIIFAIICGLIVRAPYPIFFKSYDAYFFIFNQLLYIALSAFLSFIISGILNIYIITRWKVLLYGKYFWLRSICSSTIAEALYSAIAILMMEINHLSLFNVWKIIFTSYLIKLIYSIIFSFPSSIIVNQIKKRAKIDIYDYPINYIFPTELPQKATP